MTYRRILTSLGVFERVSRSARDSLQLEAAELRRLVWRMAHDGEEKGRLRLRVLSRKDDAFQSQPSVRLWEWSGCSCRVVVVADMAVIMIPTVEVLMVAEIVCGKSDGGNVVK